MTDDMNIGQMLADQLERLLSDTVDRDLYIQVEGGQAATALWDELEGLGVTGALVPETDGGAGLSWAETEPSIRALGRHAAPLPLAETMLAHWVLATAGIDIPTGPIAVSGNSFELHDDNTLSGTDTAVSWLPTCPHVVVFATRGSDHFIGLLDTSKQQLHINETIAREPNATLSLQQSPALAIAPCELDAHGLLPYIAAIRAIQTAGALEALLALSIDYGNTREQFGRPIGKFQAIQHAITQLATQTAAAQVAGLYACRQIDAGHAFHGAMIAKTRTGTAASMGAEIAHQVFGAIGFTDEHSLHYFTRRLWQWRSDAGSEFWWAEQLGQRAIANGGDALWAAIAG